MAMNDNLLITVNKIGSKPCDGCSTDSISSVKSCKKCVMVNGVKRRRQVQENQYDSINLKTKVLQFVELAAAKFIKSGKIGPL